MDLNKAQIIGRLTADPEVRTTPNGANVASFSVATNFVWIAQGGEKKENVEYHNVVAWRKLADIIAQYVKKGRRVYVEGRLQTRSWEGPDGTKKYRTEIVADNLIMLDSPRAEGTFAGPARASAEEIPTIEADADIKNEDIPFW